jgi:hypothetical protein
MKKIYIASLLVATAITFVSAEDAKPMPTKAEAMRGSIEANVNARVAQIMPTIGDATIDAQIKALSVEMEAKVKALRDEYAVKTQGVIVNNKLTISPEAKASTVEMEAKVKALRDEYFLKIQTIIGNKKLTLPVGANAPMMHGKENQSTVGATGTSQMSGDNMEAHTEMNTEIKQVMPQSVWNRIKNFFRGFFVGSN